MSLSRLLASLLAGLLGAVGAALLLMGEQEDFVRRALPATLLVAALAGALTWRSLRD